MAQATPFRVYLVGRESLLLLCAEALLRRGHEVLGIVSGAPAILDWAKPRGIACHDPRTNLVEALGRKPFDYLFSITNLDMLPGELLLLPRRAAINFHDGPLPRYAGLFATSWALMAGERMHGVSWHLMTAGADEGDLLKQVTFEVADGETAFTLNTKCYDAGLESFEELVGELAEGRARPLPQDRAARTYFGRWKRPPAAAVVQWGRPAAEIEALVRALDFGHYPNPLAVPKLLLEGEAVVMAGADRVPGEGAGAGTIERIGEDWVQVATGQGALALCQLRHLDGRPLPVPEWVSRHGLAEGRRFPELAGELASRLTDRTRELCRHEAFWTERLAAPFRRVEVPGADRRARPSGLDPAADLLFTVPASVARALEARQEQDRLADFLVAAFGAFLGRVGLSPEAAREGAGDRTSFELVFRDPALAGAVQGLEAVFSSHVPLRFSLDLRQGLEAAWQDVSAELARVREHVSFAREVRGRYPGLGAEALPPVLIEQVADPGAWSPPSAAELALLIRADGAACRLVPDPRLLGPAALEAIAGQFALFLDAAAADLARPLSTLPLLTPDERRRLLQERNSTERPLLPEACVHHAFEAQVRRTPDALALVFEGEQLTYRQLNARANRLARRLRELGVGPDVLVGVCVERSVHMMVGTLAALKAGGAYVPLDPSYPRERLALMLKDARPAVLLTQETLRAGLPAHEGTTLCLDSDQEAAEEVGGEDLESGVGTTHLAYVLYTSGSTGRPKGVMVEHRNVCNFFAGMDECLERDPAGVWLAVTSLSFDISVLELLWTLARGFAVVLYADSAGRDASPHRRRHPLDFSLFYFASDEGEGIDDKYHLLLEGACFADRHGFAAVWTPERHFHAFGGLYPNPAVVSAALAAVTERIGIRAGSCVLPLHSPIRVAEEWALVDNLSHGRVGISFASGWQPNDFVIAPERFQDRKESMFREIETVRRLWRGESLRLPSPVGKEVEVCTRPRPVQRELPVWVTAAGNPETFVRAAEIGAGVLTHLLGQTFQEVAEKCALYRRTWRERGHAGRGTITLMLHTFVGPDEDEVRETVRGPMKGYLRSAVNLIREAAWTFPTFKQKAAQSGKDPTQMLESQALSESDMEELLDFAFERYFKTSGFFGTPESCLEIVEHLREIDVDEVACLIDYGVPSRKVLEHLPYLEQVRARVSADFAEAVAPDHSLSALVRRHGVTHLQCTPSMMSMVLGDEDSRAALAGLRQVLVGGEAFPPALADDLRRSTGAEILNMYGPTETSIWSSVHRVEAGRPIVLGHPIANTQLYVLDTNLEPLPPGVPGELFIGGTGVVRGYLNWPETTAERFVADPFQGAPARLYRTGDLVRWTKDAEFEFLGRIDNQVKIRGYRIELGEIEALLLEEPAIREAVAVVREDVPGDRRLVVYLTAGPGASIDAPALRAQLQERVPDFMVPSHVVVLSSLPLTPNAKVDRRALPPPGQRAATGDEEFLPPRTPTEKVVAEVWQTLLQVERVGRHDNFFNLGGHSLLAMQAIAHIESATGRRLTPGALALQDLAQVAAVCESGAAPPRKTESHAGRGLSRRLVDAIRQVPRGLAGARARNTPRE